MRYLTHETEDNFWTSHGARPHPLAKAEAEKRTQIRLEQQQQLHQMQQQLQQSAISSPSNSTASSTQRVPQDDQLSNSSHVSNTSSKPGSDVGVFADSSPSGTLTPNRMDDGGARSATPPKKNRKDYVSMTDDEVLKAQEHAKRVGYKVSTV